MSFLHSKPSNHCSLHWEEVKVFTITSKALYNLASITFLTSSHTNFLSFTQLQHTGLLLSLKSARHTLTLVLLLMLFPLPGTFYLPGASHLAPSSPPVISLKVNVLEVFHVYPIKKFKLIPVYVILPCLNFFSLALITTNISNIYLFIVYFAYYSILVSRIVYGTW